MHLRAFCRFVSRVLRSLRVILGYHASRSLEDADIRRGFLARRFKAGTRSTATRRGLKWSAQYPAASFRRTTSFQGDTSSSLADGRSKTQVNDRSTQPSIHPWPRHGGTARSGSIMLVRDADKRIGGIQPSLLGRSCHTNFTLSSFMARRHRLFQC